LADLDEDALRDIAKTTGGAYFRADNTETIAAAFKAIDGVKKLRFETKTKRARELFPWLVTGSLGLLLVGGLLAYTPWQREALT
jgi:Ca-activated chloride channel family protein